MREFSKALIAFAMGLWALSCAAATAGTYSYVANTSPPDAFLALRPYPSANGPRVMALANGTKLNVLSRRADGWWYVQVVPTGEIGWAYSGSGRTAYILCCATKDGSVSAATEAPATSISDFTCDQLWFGRNSIFKIAGYCFKTSRAIQIFGNAGCLYDDIASVRLSGENEELVKAIQRAEKAKSCN